MSAINSDLFPKEVYDFIHERAKQEGDKVAEAARICLMMNIARSSEYYERDFRGFFNDFVAANILPERLDTITALTLLENALLRKVGTVALNKLTTGITGQFFSLMFRSTSMDHLKNYIRVQTIDAAVALAAELRKSYSEECIEVVIEAFHPKIETFPNIVSMGKYVGN